MNILFLTTDSPDYLSDMLLHGFRKMFDENLIDFPRKDCMYEDFDPNYSLYGRGFTICRTLKNIEIDRTGIFEKVQNNYWDLIIFSSIHRQYGLYYQYFPYLNFKNTIIIDGEDYISIFPYNRFYYKHPYYWTIPKPHKHFLYFKREWNHEKVSLREYKTLLLKFFFKLLKAKNLRNIPFAIPEEKIVQELLPKTKQFPMHIVDIEVANKISASNSYVFENEKDYYLDIQNAKFGITTKKGGWECLRHYEIAANGAVICFKDLDKKSDSCAPFGLNSKNAIAYRNYEDLMRKINGLSEADYRELQLGSLDWVRHNTTKCLADRVFNEWNNSVRLK